MPLFRIVSGAISSELALPFFNKSTNGTYKQADRRTTLHRTVVLQQCLLVKISPARMT